MQTDYDTDERGEEIFEETIRGIRQGAEFTTWPAVEKSERFTVTILWPDRSVKLSATREVLHQAADDPESHPRLAREIERQLGISESGGHGFVREV
jgi:hypothetical protein